MLLARVADWLILYPSTDEMHPYGATRRTIRVNDKEVEIWTARSPGGETREPEAFVLEFCGNATRAEYIATYIADRWGNRPVEVWVVNYPGYGGSSGRANIKKISGAALGAYDELRRVAGKRPIFACGNSLGTCAALYVAANRAVAGMILQNPPPLRTLIMQRYGWWNLWIGAAAIVIEIPQSLNSLRNAKVVEAPGVFLLADHDELVLPRFQKMVVNAFNGSKRCINFAGGHNSAPEGMAAAELQMAMDWLWAEAGLSRKVKVSVHLPGSPEPVSAELRAG